MSQKLIYFSQLYEIPLTYFPFFVVLFTFNKYSIIRYSNFFIVDFLSFTSIFDKLYPPLVTASSPLTRFLSAPFDIIANSIESHRAELQLWPTPYNCNIFTHFILSFWIIQVRLAILDFEIHNL